MRLHVHEGEDEAGPTQVAWRLQETAPCTGVADDGGSDAGACAAWPGHAHRDEDDACEGDDDGVICNTLESDDEWRLHHGN